MSIQSAQDVSDTIINTIQKASKGKTMTTTAKKKAPTKRKAAPKAKPVAAVVETGEETKPQAVEWHGVTLADGADVATIEATFKEAADVIQQAADADKNTLPGFLAIGKVAFVLRPMFKSDPEFGKALAQEAPASQRFNAPDRSNAKWLYAALNSVDAEAYGDLTLDPATGEVLLNKGGNKIDPTNSSNPTTIKRKWKAEQKRQEKLAKAAEQGVEAEDEDEAIKAVEAAEKEQAEKDAKKKEAAHKRKVTTVLKRIRSMCEEHKEPGNQLTEAFDIMKDLLTMTGVKSVADQIEYLDSLA